MTLLYLVAIITKETVGGYLKPPNSTHCPTPLFTALSYLVKLKVLAFQMFKKKERKNKARKARTRQIRKETSFKAYKNAAVATSSTAIPNDLNKVTEFGSFFLS